MKNRADQETLLADILAEASPPDFRAALLAETLRRARQRRQFHHARRAAGILAALVLLAVLLAQQFSKPPAASLPVAQKIARPSYELIHTQPLPASALIHTRNFAGGAAAPVPEIIEVATGGGYRLINDHELLALFADKPAILIRTGPNSEELVFANPEDQKRFQLH